MNIELTKEIINVLVGLGIRSYCLCPGGRLAPFVEVLSKSKGLELLSFFEERSACFFALGRARRDQKAIAVLTTSGTAVAELLPGAIEAYYSGISLVFITADRPLDFGKKGSPQSLENTTDILKNYCHTSLNISQKEDLKLKPWEALQGSLHLNVCFDEPLIDEKIRDLDFSNVKFVSKHINIQNQSFSKKKKNLQNTHFFSQKEEIEQFFLHCKKPLLLVGELKPQEQALVKKLLENYKGLFYTEPLSGLEDMLGRLLSGEKILNYALEKRLIDSVIRLGAIPRSRFWRDLEKQDLPVLNLSSLPFYPGLARPSLNGDLLDFVNLLENYLAGLGDFGSSLKEFDQEQLKKWKKILTEHPQSEDSWIWILKKSLPENSKIFLGNSSPIRLWDKMAFCRKKNLTIWGQSGVNGIDGLVSRFLGECEQSKNNVAIVGDLSLLYDISGFWKSTELAPWNLVVINNFGGQIFSQMFNNPLFLNKHDLDFASLAKMWGLNYKLYKKSESFDWPKDYNNILEICPEEQETRSCFKKVVSIWDNL